MGYWVAAGMVVTWLASFTLFPALQTAAAHADVVGATNRGRVVAADRRPHSVGDLPAAVGPRPGIDRAHARRAWGRCSAFRPSSRRCSSRSIRSSTSTTICRSTRTRAGSRPRCRGSTVTEAWIRVPNGGVLDPARAARPPSVRSEARDRSAGRVGHGSDHALAVDPVRPGAGGSAPRRSGVVGQARGRFRAARDDPPRASRVDRRRDALERAPPRHHAERVRSVRRSQGLRVGDAGPRPSGTIPRWRPARWPSPAKGSSRRRSRTTSCPR